MNEMLQVIVDTTDKIFFERCTQQVMEDAEQGKWPEKLWSEITESGITRALLPEADGGADLGIADAMAVVRLAGYHTVPLPLAETMIAARLLSDAGLPVPDGPLVFAPDPPGAGIQLKPVDDGWLLTGRCSRVPWGSAAVKVLTQAHLDGRSVLICFDPTESSVTRGANLAFEPRDNHELKEVRIARDALIEIETKPLVATLGALVRSQQLAGAMQRVLDMSVRYAGERIQFGRPIGKFQAIQQQLAVMAGHVAAGNAVAEAAADGWLGDKREFFVAVAKSRAGEAAGEVAAIAHQVHGAMGFTREHPLHYATRRLWSWRDEFGNENSWQRYLGHQVLNLGADRLWPFLVQPSVMQSQEECQ